MHFHILTQLTVSLSPQLIVFIFETMNTFHITDIWDGSVGKGGHALTIP